MAAGEEASNRAVQEVVVVNAGGKVGVIELDLLVGVKGRGRLSLVQSPTFDQINVHSDCRSEKIPTFYNLDNKMSLFLTHRWNS